MEREFWRILPYILGGMFGIGLLLFLLAMHQLRRRRTGSYWRVRRKAGERGGRLFIVSVFLVALSLVATLVGGIGFLVRQPDMGGEIRGPDDLYGVKLPSAAELTTATGDAIAATTVVQAQTQAAQATPPPTQAATATLTLPAVPTATMTPIPSTPTLDIAALVNTNTPMPTATLSAAELLPRIRIDAANSRPVQSSDTTRLREFPSGIGRVYFYFAFENMVDGGAWTRALYREGDPIQQKTLVWDLGAAGSSNFYFAVDGGFQPGRYEVRVFVGTDEASRYAFQVADGVGETAVQ